MPGTATPATGASTFTWRGLTYPVTSERVRVALGQAAEAAHQVNTPDATGLTLEQRLPPLDRIIQAYNDAKGFIRHSMNTSAGGVHNSLPTHACSG